MRIMTLAIAFGMALVMCNVGTFGAAAHARKDKVFREPRQRLFVSVPWQGQPPTGIPISFHVIAIALRTTGSIHTDRPSCRSCAFGVVESCFFRRGIEPGSRDTAHLT